MVVKLDIISSKSDYIQ